VLAVDARGTQAVAGGTFTVVGPQRFNGVAAWDGRTWSPIGPGLPGACTAVRLRGREILAAVRGAGVLLWNGQQWGSLGTCPDLSVQALVAQGETVYAGGYGTDATTNLRTAQVWRWDGSGWTSLGAGTGGDVAALESR